MMVAVSGFIKTLFFLFLLNKKKKTAFIAYAHFIVTEKCKFVLTLLIECAAVFCFYYYYYYMADVYSLLFRCTVFVLLISLPNKSLFCLSFGKMFRHCLIFSKLIEILNDTIKHG